MPVTYTVIDGISAIRVGTRVSALETIVGGINPTIIILLSRTKPNSSKANNVLLENILGMGGIKGPRNAESMHQLPVTIAMIGGFRL